MLIIYSKETVTKKSNDTMPFVMQPLHSGMMFPYVTQTSDTPSDHPKPSLTGGAAVLFPSLHHDNAHCAL